MTYASIFTREHKTLTAPLADPALDTVYLHGATKKLDLTPLTALPLLKNLSFDEPSPDLSIIPRLSTLEMLDLSSCKSADLSQLAGSSLITLLLPKKAVDLTQLTKLPNLRNLALHTGYADLAGLPLHLTSLSVYERAADLAPIAHLTALEGLTLYCEAGLTLEGLAPLGALTTLTLHGCAASDLTPLANLTALRALDLSGDKPLRDLAPLAGLTKLAHLNLYKTSVADLAPLAGLPALTYLNASHTKIKALAALPALEHLYAERSALRDLTGVEAMPLLKTLFIGHTKVRDLAPLTNHPALTHLGADALGAVANAFAVATLPALTHLDVTKTTFDPMLLAHKPEMASVRGCEYPPPGLRRLDDPAHAPLDGAHMGPGALLDGRWCLTSLPGVPHDAALAADGQHAAVAMYQHAGVVVARSVDGAIVAALTPQASEVYSGVAFAPDGALWLARYDGYNSHHYSIYRWDWQADASPVHLADARTDGLARLYASPDGAHLALIYAGGVQLFDAAGALVRTLAPVGERYYEASAAVWGADGSLWWADGHERVGRYDATTGQRVEERRIAPVERAHALTLSDDGRWLAAQGMHARRTVCVDLVAGEPVLAEQIDGAWGSRAAAVTPDGALVVTCDGGLRAYRLPGGEAQEGPQSLGIGNPYFAGALAAPGVVCFVMANWSDPSRLIFARVNP